MCVLDCKLLVVSVLCVGILFGIVVMQAYIQTNPVMRKFILAFFVVLLYMPVCQAQESVPLHISVKEAVDIARRQSPDIIAARHSFRASYWSYVYYKANYLPSLSFASNPYFNHQINPINMPDGTMQYVEQNQLITDAGLSLTQNIPWTGGALSLTSSLQRMDMFGSDKSHTYKSVPVTVTYQQSLSAYNALRWDKRTEPLRFKEAKQSYVEMLELVAVRAATKFFDLAKAQTDLDIAKINYANADTLYTIAKGRYAIGTITENDMLSLEVKRLTEESNMMDALIEVDNSMQELRSYLGITDVKEIQAVVNDEIPSFMVDYNTALEMALENNPDITGMELRLKESLRAVAQAKSQAGLKANVYAQFGLTQTGKDISRSYSKPLDQQYAEIGIQIPILDWGRSKGKVQVAKSQYDMQQIRVKQDMDTFEQNVAKIVKQFNQQTGKVDIAARADVTALRRNNVALRLYMLGKSTILDLNSATAEKDAAKRTYVNALSSYWSLYYTLRSLTLYDFEKNIPLTADYELLLK